MGAFYQVQEVPSAVHGIAFIPNSQVEAQTLSVVALVDSAFKKIIQVN